MKRSLLATTPNNARGRVSGTRPRAWLASTARNVGVPYAFLLPSLVFLVGFTLWPIVSVIRSSFYAPKGRDEVYVGFENLDMILNSSIGRQVLWNTAIYVLGGLVISVFGGFLLAVMLDRQLRWRNLSRFPFLVPIALPMVSAAAIWLFLFAPQIGLLNSVLGVFGIAPINWLGDPQFALPSLLGVYGWKTLGYFSLFYLAALQSIPKSVIEAATIDGANAWQTMRHLLWPLVSPTTYFVATIGVVNAMQQIDHILLLTSGGPNNETNLSMYYVYEQGFVFFQSGRAAAMTVVLLVALVTMAIFQHRYLERRVHYGTAD